MSAVLHRLASAPSWLLTGPPLLFAVSLGLTVHHTRTRKQTSR